MARKDDQEQELVGVGEIVKRTGLAMHNVRAYTYEDWHPAAVGRFSGRRVWRWGDIARALREHDRWDGIRKD